MDSSECNQDTLHPNKWRYKYKTYLLTNLKQSPDSTPSRAAINEIFVFVGFSTLYSKSKLSLTFMLIFTQAVCSLK